MKIKDLYQNKKFESSIENLAFFEGLMEEDQRKALQKLKTQNKEMIEISSKYNDLFSDRGWICHSSINFEIMKEAISEFEKDGIEKAEKVIIGYYEWKQLKDRLVLLWAIKGFRERRRLLELVFDDYINKRYHGVIPVLLMIVDGTMNDYANIGFHAQSLNLSNWDSILDVDEGITKIKEILVKSRTQTNHDEITLPYRNGILHGRELNYDNETVAAKCWALLFYVRDWILDKENEKARQQQKKKEQEPVRIEQSIDKYKKSIEISSFSNTWSARKTKHLVKKINKGKVIPNEDSPEKIVLQFLEAWKKNNYGHMAENFSEHLDYVKSKHAGDLRKKYKNERLESYEILEIVDESPTISMIIAKVNTTRTYSLQFRCIYESEDEKYLPRGYAGGNWKFIFVVE